MLGWVRFLGLLATTTATYEQSLSGGAGGAPADPIEASIADALTKARPGAVSDPAMTAACREFLEGKVFTSSPGSADFDLFRYLLWRQGVGDTVLLPYRGKFESEAKARLAMKGVVAQLLGAPFNRFGIAVRVDAKKRVDVAIVVSQREVGFTPIPRMVQPGTNVDTTIVTASSRDVRVLVQEPQGTTIEHSIGKIDGASAPLTLSIGDDEGRYDVEIVFLEEAGPYIAASFPVYVGREFPDRFVAPVYEQEAGKIPDAEIEAKLVKLVNETRARYKLEPVRADATLTRLAREHSVDMRKNGFGRSSPGRGTLTTRLTRSHVWFRDATEVIGAGVSSAAIHASLMSSPAHRIVLLDSHLRDLGVGVAVVKPASGPMQAYATEILAALVPKIDPADAGKRLLARINEKRAESGLAALQPDEALATVASTHARAMAVGGKPAYEVRAKKGAKPFSLFDSAKKASPGAKALGGFVGVLETLEDPVDFDAVLDPEMSKAGVGVTQASSAEYGQGAIWIAVVVAR